MMMCQDRTDNFTLLTLFTEPDSDKVHIIWKEKMKEEIGEIWG
jgi:hypothetical protein